MAKLFHSLVVLGAGVSASACGGATSIGTGGKLDENAGTGGKLGLGGSSGGSAGTGGTVVIGGAFGSGGLVESGGAGGVATMNPLPDAGTLAQWNCDAGQLSGCSLAAGSSPLRPTLRDACPIDPNRPRSEADCGSNEWFQCRAALWMGQTAIAINCECTPILDGGCGSCEPVDTDRSAAACSGHTKLCGCAYTGITH